MNLSEPRPSLPNIPPPFPSDTQSRSGLIKKIIVPLAVVIILAEAVWAYFTLWKNNHPLPLAEQTRSLPSQAQKTTTLALTTTDTNLKAGDKFRASINIDSAGQTDGVDVIIKYDPKMLTVIPNSLNSPVTTNPVYNNYPLNKVDEKSGTIFLSGISTIGAVMPRGILGTIDFQAKAAGRLTLSFDFQKGNTNDTNVTETTTAKDILDSVINLTIEVKPK